MPSPVDDLCSFAGSEEVKVIYTFIKKGKISRITKQHCSFRLLVP